MPRDEIGAPAPRPLSFHLREQRLKILSRAAKRAARSRRRVTALRLAEAEAIIKAVVEGGDVLGEVIISDAPLSRPLVGVALMVTMTMYDFRRLCRYGAELEDDEDTHDAEPATAEDEPSLGSMDRELDQSSWGRYAYDDFEAGDEDNEPGLGSTHLVNQMRWSEGFYGGDNERDPAEREPSLGAPETTATGGQARWAEGGTHDAEAGEDDEPAMDDEPSLCGDLDPALASDDDAQHQVESAETDAEDCVPLPDMAAAIRERRVAR